MTRKPTIDDYDDVDDEDGAAEKDRRRQERSDLSLRETRDPGFGKGDEGYLEGGRNDVDEDPKSPEEEEAEAVLRRVEAERHGRERGGSR